jgi:hypothetical protein
MTSSLAMNRALFVSLAVFALLLPGLARAQDRFEIQVYDSETAPKGGTGIEMHVNFVAAGSQAVSPDGELPTNHVTHVTFEPHLGLASWCELGGYLQSAIRPDGSINYAGFKLRYKMRIPHRLAKNVIGLAVNFELSWVPSTYEANVYGSEVRPILDVEWRRLYFAINPILSTDLGGALAGQTQFQPAAKFTVAIVPMLAMGVEYYAAFGPINQPFGLAEQSHRLLGVLDLTHKLTDKTNFELNFGGGHTFGAGDAWVAKMIVGIGQ